MLYPVVPRSIQTLCELPRNLCFLVYCAIRMEIVGKWEWLASQISPVDQIGLRKSHQLINIHLLSGCDTVYFLFEKQRDIVLDLSDRSNILHAGECRFFPLCSIKAPLPFEARFPKVNEHSGGKCRIYLMTSRRLPNFVHPEIRCWWNINRFFSFFEFSLSQPEKFYSAQCRPSLCQPICSPPIPWS